MRDATRDADCDFSILEGGRKELKGSITRRGKDPRKWTLVFDASRVSGQRKQQWVKFEGTKREAEAKLRELCGEVDDGQYIRGKETLGAFLDLWLGRVRARVMIQSGVDRDRSPNTWRRYESLVRLNIKPVLGHIVLTKLTPLDIERAIDAWREMPVRNSKSGKKLSGRTVFNIFETLNSALTKAVSWKQLKANPCAHVEAPRKGNSQISPLAPANLGPLLARLQSRAVFVPVLFLALAGVRRNEMLGMKRANVDLDQAIAFVDEQQTRLLDGSLASKETKTSRRRIVTLSPLLVDALRIHMARTKGELLFPSLLGGPWKATSFSSNLRKACEGLGFEVSPQRIRRAFSTIGDRAGAAHKAVAEIMGHSAEINQRHYNDVALADKRVATDLVEASVSKLLANLGVTLEKP